MGTVQGYLTPLDARLIAALLAYQNQNRIRGYLCEIGVHHGRLFLMLALARQYGERSLGIDLFEDDAINISCQQPGRDRALFVNARRLGIRFSKEETFITSSLDIGPAANLARATGPIRFWSIDGGHLYRQVENDLRLAEATVAPWALLLSMISLVLDGRKSALPFTIFFKRLISWFCLPSLDARFTSPTPIQLRYTKLPCDYTLKWVTRGKSKFSEKMCCF